jgi:hypothetical protein
VNLTTSIHLVLVVSYPLGQPEVTSRSRDVNKDGVGVNDL